MTNYKKIIKGIFYMVSFLLIVIPRTIYAATQPFVFCEGNVLVAFRILGLVIAFVKIGVPILLMVLTSINVFKAMLAGDDKDYKGSATLFGKRLLISLIIFILPSIIDGVLSIVSKDYNNISLSEGSSDSFAACTKCMLNIDSCPQKIG